MRRSRAPVHDEARRCRRAARPAGPSGRERVERLLQQRARHRARARRGRGRSRRSPCCAASSLPAVLPSCSAPSVASSTSSTTWKARPIARGVARQARQRRRSPAPPRTAPPRTQAPRAARPSWRGAGARASSASIVRALRLEVHHLAADEAGRAAGLAEDRRGREPPAQPRRVQPGGHLGQQVEGPRQQRVAGQDRDRLAEDLVRGRLAAAQVVVVHGRQVVVDQAVGVDHLHGAGERHQLRRARRRPPRRRPAPGSAGCACRRRTGCSARRGGSWPATPSPRAGRGRAPRPRAAPHRSRRSREARPRSALSGRRRPRPPGRGAASSAGPRRRATASPRASFMSISILPSASSSLRVAEAREADALLVELQRLLEGQLALLEAAARSPRAAAARPRSVGASACRSRGLLASHGGASSAPAWRRTRRRVARRDLVGVAHEPRARPRPRRARSRGESTASGERPSSFAGEAAERGPPRARGRARKQARSRSRCAAKPLAPGRRPGGPSGRPRAARAARRSALARRARAVGRGPSPRGAPARRRAGRGCGGGRARPRRRGATSAASTRARTRARRRRSGRGAAARRGRRRARSRSSLACTTRSAAADGVGARRSATKSAIVKSVSWPTAEIVGIREAASARATASSLKGQRSSRLPPPRATMSTSSPPSRLSARMPCDDLAGAPRAPARARGRRSTSRFA